MAFLNVMAVEIILTVIQATILITGESNRTDSHFSLLAVLENYRNIAIPVLLASIVPQVYCFICAISLYINIDSEKQREAAGLELARCNPSPNENEEQPLNNACENQRLNENEEQSHSNAGENQCFMVPDNLPDDDNQQPTNAAESQRPLKNAGGSELAMAPEDLSADEPEISPSDGPTSPSSDDSSQTTTTEPTSEEPKSVVFIQVHKSCSTIPLTSPADDLS